MDEFEIPPSSLAPVAKKIKEVGTNSDDPLFEDDLHKVPVRANEIFERPYVPGALELAQMLDMEDRGSINPTRGLSFRAKNGKYYDFTEYWLLMGAAFKETTRMAQEATLNLDTEREQLMTDVTAIALNISQKIRRYKKWLTVLGIITILNTLGWLILFLRMAS